MKVNWFFIITFLVIAIAILLFNPVTRKDTVINLKLIPLWIISPLLVALFTVVAAMTDFKHTDLQSLDTK